MPHENAGCFHNEIIFGVEAFLDADHQLLTYCLIRFSLDNQSWDPSVYFLYDTPLLVKGKKVRLWKNTSTSGDGPKRKG
jgi:hypothetical protein